jgi:energy-coupling factor transporter ATP-binding protein EcfA2
MFLKRFVFVNWGNIPNGEFEFGPVNLFSGANGSGKTTAADALQTIMTAAHENLFHYNPGQEETTQRGRGGKRVRTLASYVLGCDDGSYARTEATDGYIAAIFHSTQEENAEPFTAVVGVRSWLDQSGKQPLAREEQPLFFVLPEVELDIGAFIQEQGGAPQVVLLDDIQQKLITRFGKRAVERYDQKRAYLRRLYGALRGKRDSVSEREATAAARAFSRFMAYKPVSSINQFVADEVLERKDLGEAIRSVSSQLKTIHGMEREAQALKDSALLLEKAGNHTQHYLDGWIDLQTLNYSRARASFLQRQDDFLKAIEAREAAERDLKENAVQIDLAAQRHAQLRDTLINLEAQRKGIPALQEKDALQKDQGALQKKLGSATAQLLTGNSHLEQNLRSVRALTDLLASPSLAVELPQVTDMEARRLVKEALDTATRCEIELPRLLQKDLTNDLAMLEKHLDDARHAQHAHVELREYWQRREMAAQSRRDVVADTHQGRRQRYDQISTQLTQKQGEIARLEAKQVVYPQYVERALAAIRAQCPQADARVLCDHIEVVDPRWQSAIEGYMGGARFGIIVDSDYEAQAIRIVRALTGRDNRARIIQGTKALRDAARIKAPPESIIHVLKFTHAVAQAYVMASYGSVVRVESADELRQSARGLTADGMGSGGYTLFRCDVPDADLVFGAAARERALNARRAEVERLNVERQDANTRMQESARLLEAIDQLVPLAYADSLAALLDLHRDIRRVEMLLQQLDVGGYESLDSQLSLLRNEDVQLREHEAGLNRRAGELRGQITGLDQSMAQLGKLKEAAQDALSGAETALLSVHAEWPQFDLEARLSHAREQAKTFNAVRADRDREDLEGRLHKAQDNVATTLLQHNQKCRPADAIVYTAFTGNYDAALFHNLCELRREIDRVYNILKNNVLVEKHEQLKRFKVSFNDAFVSHLCQEIHQSLLDGERQLELLNKELVEHRFGSDRERFRFAQDWVPEFREYASFLKEVVHNPSIGEEGTLFEARLSAKSAAVRDKLMELLLGEDEQRSLRELERIADYRNYHRYEIYKEVEGKPPIALSEYGTGSGGQLETPAYIIRSASITSALRYAEGTNHLRMVLVDEAFSKMDESRSREVIDYLTHSLGLQLIFIMPTSKCGPFMDLISNEFVFAKVPSAPRGQLQTRVLVDRKQCNQERIVELWKRHRRTVRQQAELDFMSDVWDQETAEKTSGGRR